MSCCCYCGADTKTVFCSVRCARLGKAREQAAELRERILEGVQRTKEALESMKARGQVVPDPLIPIIGAAALLGDRIKAMSTDDFSLLDAFSDDSLFDESEEDMPTREQLLKAADTLERAGQHEVAEWLREQAEQVNDVEVS